MKKLILFISCMAALHVTHAQFMANEIGASIIVGTGKQKVEGFSYNSVAAFRGGTLYARYNFMQKENSAVSVGSMVSFGFAGVANSRTGSTIQIGLDVPITVDYHFGYGSTEENEKRFGSFVGAGFSYTYTSFESDYEFGRLGSLGPLAQAGIRFPMGMNGRGITLRGFYKKGFDKQNYNFFGGSLLYRF
jgi:hypothetical protein